MNFSELKDQFNQENNNTSEFTCFLPTHLSSNKKTFLLKKDGSKNEEFYKWQFLYALINSGLVAKDYIGTEIHFPKGNKSSAPIKIDSAIFDDKNWFEKYQDYHINKNLESLDWLRDHLITAIEFKKENNKNIKEIWDKQLKAYLKESHRNFCLGILYDTERLYLFQKNGGKFIRYSDNFNTKGENSKTDELSLHIPDPYFNIPNFQKLLDNEQQEKIDLSKRNIYELETISGIHSIQINDVMSNILRTMDKVGLTNQRGFEILIQIISLKIFDEKRNEKTILTI